uniref:Uncharacterized protein n=1 Tax=Anguilla anguilla TaxID=7936 RepID=A0A0E9WDG2_ANGAN
MLNKAVKSRKLNSNTLCEDKNNYGKKINCDNCVLSQNGSKTTHTHRQKCCS